MEPMGADELTVQGYIACAKCGEWLVESGRAVPVCPDCRRALKDLSDAGRLRYEVEGRSFQTRARRDQRKRPKQKATPERIAARKARDRATMAAMIRLTHLYRPMYELLRDEELIRQGCVPNWRTVAPRPRVVSETLLEDLLDAEERETERARRLTADR